MNTAPADDKTLARMRKLLALAERGEAGERDNAQRMLEKMLDRHNMRPEDLAGVHRTMRWFRARDTVERRLIIQIAAKVLNTSVSAYRRTNKSRLVGIEATPAESIEIELHIEALRPALAKHLDLAFSAFVQANALYRDSTDDERTKPMSRAELEEAEKVLRMASVTGATPVHKRLGRAA